jgi:hypothetical protein
MSFEQPTENIRFPQVASEIQQMIDVDQTMREQNAEDDSWDEEVDVRHTNRMKELVAEIGWPSIYISGSRTSGERSPRFPGET